ncbi:hypothetical protein [Nocardioides daeguensis]|uniref:Uncharacterized protein n=1 Tax=Nocardioides daeguensis TaxID=908359 RepID=A0ABP6V9V0_9ACTN|nr:hypothetical protein [Nocardioides daeguensis]MBV6726324.1 hypothetical protein [Nocardioides daeguensis]MCR1772167.1 hypothetical protein [Nocardioides daeguensis]
MTSSTTPPTTPSVSLAVPRRWTAHDTPAPGVLLVARAPAATPCGVTPELALRTGPVDPALSLAAWRAEALAALAGQLDALEVEDTDVVDLDDLDIDLGGEAVAYARFSHRLDGIGGLDGIDGIDVVCDQWAWLRDGVGVTLTGTVAREDYADYADLFEQVAATVEVSARGPGSAPPAAARW